MGGAGGYWPQHCSGMQLPTAELLCAGCLEEYSMRTAASAQIQLFAPLHRGVGTRLDPAATTPENKASINQTACSGGQVQAFPVENALLQAALDRIAGEQ